MPRIRLPFISRRKWDKLRDALIREYGNANCACAAYGFACATDKRRVALAKSVAYARALGLLDLIEHEK